MELFQVYSNQQKTRIFSFYCALFLFCFTFFSCSNIGSFSKFSQDYIDDCMLVMVYIAGANSLNYEVVMDINSMESGLFLAKQNGYPNLKVVALVDKKSSVENESWTGTRLYEIQSFDKTLNTGKIHSKLIESASNSLGEWRITADQEEDMGNIQTLENFILWATENYPQYKKHSLILWNHGGGIFSDYKPLKYICTDEESGKTSESLDNVLYIAEIEQLLSRLYPKENPIEFLGMDACFMAMYEVAYQFKDSVKYMAFSPATEWGGWNYEYIFSQKDTHESGKNFAINAVDGYKLAYNSVYPNTLTACDLQFVNEVKEKIDNLSYALGIEFTQDSTTLKEKIEKVKDNSIFMHLKDDKKINTLLLQYPYYELGSLLYCFSNQNKILKNDNGVTFSSYTQRCAIELQDILSKMILKTWLSDDYGISYLKSVQSKANFVFEKNIPYGISIFFSSKDNFDFQGFYTAEKSGTEGVLGYGEIKAANKTDNDVIDTWYELQCALYQD